MNGNSIFIVLLLQAIYTVQQMDFNFPTEIQALFGSCVEIPCTYQTPLKEPKSTNVVWHAVRRLGPRVIYSSDPSEISSYYKDRAALIGNPEESCTLRIHEVAKNDERRYYPDDKKSRSSGRVSTFVQLWVTDIPPQPELSLPVDIIEGTPTLVMCFVKHTCATSPPTLSWNFSGLPVKKKNIDIGKGKWLTTSELTYQPSGEHNGSSILCIATFPNGQTSQTAAILHIKKAEHKFNRNCVPIIAACSVSLLLIVFFICRFFLGKKKLTSRSCNLLKRKNDIFTAKDGKDTGYTDLKEREITSYCTLKPAMQEATLVQATENTHLYTNIYEKS